MMRRILIFLLFAGCFIQRMSAVVAYPYPIRVTQPDGSTLTITLHGDEFYHWMTVDGKVVCKGNDGFYHPDTLSRQVLETASLKRQAINMKRVALQKEAESSDISIGTHHFLVMLIETEDVRFTIPQPDSAFYRMMNQENYTGNEATGSVRDYFCDQSLGKFTPVFDLVGPVTVHEPMSNFTKDYGQTQSGAPALLVKACQIADSIVDFSKYDLDNDGIIDNIFFFYSGYNSAEGADGTIWPHSWSVSAAKYFDGKRLGDYACTSELRGISGCEMAGIGTFCHEFGHVIGLPDFYDTDGDSHGSGKGLWKYSLMCYGNYNNDGKTPPYFNCEERYILGWIDSIPWMPATDTIMTVQSIQNAVGFRSPTNNDGEYYLYEYRPAVKWDTPNVPGLLIYHVDKSGNIVNGMTAANRWKYGNGINNDATHPCFQLIMAEDDGQIYPFGNNRTQFNANTVPSSIAWNNTPSLYGLYDITCDTLAASFLLLYNHPQEIYGTVTDTTGTPVPNAVVSVCDSIKSEPSDSLGRYSLVLRMPGTPVSQEDSTVFQLTVTAPDYDSLTVTLTVLAGAKEHDFTLKGKKTALEDIHFSDSDITSPTHAEIFSIDGRLLARIPVNNGAIQWQYNDYQGIVIVRYGNKTVKRQLR